MFMSGKSRDRLENSNPTEDVLTYVSYYMFLQAPRNVSITVFSIKYLGKLTILMIRLVTVFRGC